MNEILIYESIGEGFFDEGITATSIKKQLDKFDGDVTVRINSPGGDVFEGNAIFNLLQGYERGQISVIVDGIAASIASVIAMAGDLKMADNAMLMIHNPWTMAIGDAREMLKMSDTLDKVKETLITTYESKTNLDRDVISQLMDDETWFDATGAKENGFADEIGGATLSIAACAVPWIRNQPEVTEEDGAQVVKFQGVGSKITVKRDPAKHPEAYRRLQRLAARV